MNATLDIIVCMLVAAALSWWLSGFDPRLQGNGSFNDLLRRLARCGATGFIILGGAWCEWRVIHYHDPSVFVIYLALTLLLALLWVGCLAEAGAKLFVFLTDPVSREKFDPGRVQRDLDRLAGLVRDHRDGEALSLCAQLEANHEISDEAAREIRNRLGAKQRPAAAPKSLAAAMQLQETGKLVEAEDMMLGLLQAQPRDVEAAFALMRLYLRERKDRSQAQAVLDRLAQEPHMPRDLLELAAKSFDEWSRPAPVRMTEFKPAPLPTESAEELIEQKRYGSAIELVEHQIKERPGNFELQLRLLELHGRYCGNFKVATKMMHQFKTNPAFTLEQREIAQAKFKEWHDAARG